MSTFVKNPGYIAPVVRKDSEPVKVTPARGWTPPRDEIDDLGSARLADIAGGEKFIVDL